MHGFFASIQALLSAPNPDDPLSENIAKHWKTNEAEAVETGNVGLASITCFFNTDSSFVLHLPLFHLETVAKEWTRLYASGT